jgi:hypothetical protein
MSGRRNGMKRLSWLKERYSAPVPPEKMPDVALLAQLWADQFQHMTTLALAGGGGLLVLLQTNIVRTDRTFWTTLVLFALMAVFSVVGQTSVVDDATQGRPPGRQTRLMRALALMALGAAAMGAIDVLT